MIRRILTSRWGGISGALALLAIAGAIWLQSVGWVRGLAPAICPGAAARAETEIQAIALTIDDGPSVDPQVTAAILNVLAAHQAHATFFLIGEHLPGSDRELARLIPEGHELGNHLSADRPAVALGPLAFARDAIETGKALEKIATHSGDGERVRWLRPGSGFCSASQQAIARDLGDRVALGSIWPLDTLPIPPAISTQIILANLHPGGILVLHDRGPADARGRRAARTLELLLPKLQERGYRVVTLSELEALGELVPSEENAWPVWSDRLRGRAMFGFVIRTLSSQQGRALLALFSATNGAILAIGFATGFLRWQWLPGWLPMGELLGTSARLLLFPALFEEWLFRGLFLPAAAEFDNRPSNVGLAIGVVGLLLYVASHLPSGYVTDRLTGGQTGFFATFRRVDALACTTLLGLACTLSYLYCGSLYPAIAEHWLVVWIWFFVCGGYARLYPAAAGQLERPG